MDTPQSPVEQFRTYAFETDPAYQTGLQSMIATGALEGKDKEEETEWLFSTKLFYFNRITGQSLTADEVRLTPDPESTGSSSADEGNNVQDPSTAAPNLFPSEPRALSLAELKELIEQGKTDQIPNNRVIPDILSTDSPSESKAPIRKKPWET
ncbi:hypothetical protein BDW22DRAFT_1334412 [Trametopsis cervina]|nr:hypothetical protein BDW22DRAFT_1334412 [Trametopsis cervina]